jgi:hypothetical protein
MVKRQCKKNAIIETLAAKLEVASNQPDQALNQYMRALNILSQLPRFNLWA